MPRCAEPGCGRWRPLVGGRILASLQLNGRWYCSSRCVERAARAGLDDPTRTEPQSSWHPPFRLGVLLRHLSVLSDEQLTVALDRQRRSGRRLGTELLALGWVAPDAVVRALAIQGSVRYLASFDPEVSRPAAAVLPAATVRALGLVPFEADVEQRRLSVLCAAPVPRAALRALATMTDWTPEPFLVLDDIWKRALDVYQGPESIQSDTVTVRGMGEAAACVAEAAAETRSVTMRQAPCDPYVWVRVEGPAAQVRDVFIHAPTPAATALRQET